MTNFNKEFRRQDLQRGIDDILSRSAHGVVIVNTNAQTEEVTYAGSRPGSRMTVTHPYIGPNSWVRIMSERGTKAMVQNRAEDGEPFISAYLQENNAKKNTRSTEEDKFYYRALREGEIDIVSPGIASVFASRRGSLSLRGGTTRVTLDAGNSLIASRSLTQTWSVLGSSRTQSLDNQMRFGLVTRPGNLNSNRLLAEPTITQFIEVLPNYYAKEYHRNLTSDGPVSGITLIDHREGDVYDDSGKPIKNSITGKLHRSRTQWGTQVPGVVTEASVDVEGNVTLTIPNVATKGMHLKIDGFGDLKLEIGRDVIATIARNVMLSISKDFLSKATNHTFNTKDTNEMTGQMFYANTDAVKLVKNPDQHIPRGEDLLNWLITHTHSSPTGPTSPPIQPALPQILLSRTAMVK